MYSFTAEEFEQLRIKKLYKKTNQAWNDSGINHPKNVGYLMNHIGNLRPQNYEEWEEYFYTNILSKNALLQSAKKFRKFVLKDLGDYPDFDYSKLSDKCYYKMVVCRLIYETWIGYFAEEETKKLLVLELFKDNFEIGVKQLSPEDDNKYAVDFLIYYNGVLICGMQVKSVNYEKSETPILLKTKETNHKKNQMFSKEFGVPVQYVYYERKSPDEYEIANLDIVSVIEKMLLTA